MMPQRAISFNTGLSQPAEMDRKDLAALLQPLTVMMMIIAGKEQASASKPASRVISGGSQ